MSRSISDEHTPAQKVNDDIEYVNLHPMFKHVKNRKQAKSIVKYQGHMRRNDGKSTIGGDELDDLDKLEKILGQFEERYGNEQQKSLVSQLSRISASIGLYNNPMAIETEKNIGPPLVRKDKISDLIEKPAKISELLENAPKISEMLEEKVDKKVKTRRVKKSTKKKRYKYIKGSNESDIESNEGEGGREIEEGEVCPCGGSEGDCKCGAGEGSCECAGGCKCVDGGCEGRICTCAGGCTQCKCGPEKECCRDDGNGGIVGLIEQN